MKCGVQNTTCMMRSGDYCLENLISDVPHCPNRIPITNADRIRAMPDEKLAVTLMCPNEMGMADIPCDHSDGKNCCRCLLDWLRQPAEGSEQCIKKSV